jgi:hypothetical protein
VSPLYTLYKSAGGPKYQSLLFGKENHYFLQPGMRLQIFQHAAWTLYHYATLVSQMLYSFYIWYVWPTFCFCLEICLSFYSQKLSDEENVHVYGKCNNVNGHGHNYVGEFIVTNLATFFNKTNTVLNRIINFIKKVTNLIQLNLDLIYSKMPSINELYRNFLHCFLDST